MFPQNRKPKSSTGFIIYRFELIAKDCDIEMDCYSWGLQPTDGKRHILFLTETKQKINEYIRILTIKEIQFEAEDITESIVKMKNPDPLLLRAYKSNPIFKEAIDSIRVQYLNLDDILDKVNDFGFGSLDELELNFLKKYK